MKKSFKQVIKPVIAVLLVSVMTSSCVVRTKAHRPPPPPTEKVIIKP